MKLNLQAAKEDVEAFRARVNAACGNTPDSVLSTAKEELAKNIELKQALDKAELAKNPALPENNGHNGNYYSLYVANPMKAAEPYTVECADVIENLRMDFNEGEAFKAIWRKAARRLGNEKQGSNDLYDAQKVAHYGARMEVMSKQAKGE